MTTQSRVNEMYDTALELLRPYLANPDLAAPINRGIPPLLQRAIQARINNLLFQDEAFNMRKTALDLAAIVNNSRQMAQGTPVSVDQITLTVEQGMAQVLRKRGFGQAPAVVATQPECVA